MQKVGRWERIAKIVAKIWPRKRGKLEGYEDENPKRFGS